MNVVLQPADLFLVHGTSKLGRMIRWAERTRGEELTWANHAGMIVSGGNLKDVESIESLWKTRRGPFYANHIGEEISIFRFRQLLPEQRYAIVRKMREFVGDTYGWQRLIAHLIDNKIFGGRIVVRKYNADHQDRPICSYSTGLAYEFGEVTFGPTPAIALQPDDMDDWCLKNFILWQPIVYRERL